jgi:HSP20 family molecular chaperone IbpA
MTNNAAELVQDDESDNESDRPTLVPPGPSPTRQVEKSDMDATWPGEAPRHSFIAERPEPREDSDVFETRARAPRIPQDFPQHLDDTAAAPRDESAIVRVPEGPDPSAVVPPVDSYEDDRALLVFIDMPGVAPESLAIELSNVALYVRGALPHDPKRQLPLPPGRRELVIDVPRGTEAEAVDASLRNGLLRIRVDKTGATTRHVDIAHPGV